MLSGSIYVWYVRIGIAHLLQSRIDEAIVWLEKACGAHAGLPYAHSQIASAYALRGETERAAIELAEARRLSGDDRYSSIARLKPLMPLGVPKDPRSARSHVFRWPAQGGYAGAMIAGLCPNS